MVKVTTEVYRAIGELRFIISHSGSSGRIQVTLTRWFGSPYYRSNIALTRELEKTFNPSCADVTHSSGIATFTNSFRLAVNRNLISTWYVPVHTLPHLLDPFTVILSASLYMVVNLLTPSRS